MVLVFWEYVLSGQDMEFSVAVNTDIKGFGENLFDSSNVGAVDKELIRRNNGDLTDHQLSEHHLQGHEIASPQNHLGPNATL